VELSIEETVARNKARFAEELARYGACKKCNGPLEEKSPDDPDVCLDYSRIEAGWDLEDL
jgi:hypothetical protein